MLRRLVFGHWSIHFSLFGLPCTARGFLYVCQGGVGMAGGLALTLLCVLIQHRGRVSGVKGSAGEEGGGDDSGSKGVWGAHMP